MSIFTINKDNWKRKFIILKTILSRGYIWCQLPALSIIGAGVLAPYFPEIRLAYLASAAFIIMLLVGYIDVHFRFLHEEQRYITEQNPTLMEGLFHNNSIKVDVISAQEIIDSLEDEE